MVGEGRQGVGNTRMPFKLCPRACEGTKQNQLSFRRIPHPFLLAEFWDLLRRKVLGLVGTFMHCRWLLELSSLVLVGGC